MSASARRKIVEMHAEIETLTRQRDELFIVLERISRMAGGCYSEWAAKAIASVKGEDADNSRLLNQAMALTRQRDELMAELEHAATYHASHECYAEANRVRKFIASVKESK
jgi:hypothetical protein